MVEVTEVNSSASGGTPTQKRLDPDRFVRLSGLGWWFKDSDVESLCEGHGKVVKINFAYDRSNGKSTGDAEAEFEDSAAAARAFAALKEHDFGRDVQIEIISQSDLRIVSDFALPANDNRKIDVKNHVEPQQTSRPPPHAFPPNIFMPHGQAFPRPVFPPPGMPTAPVGFPGAGGFPMIVPGMEPNLMWNNPAAMPPMPQPVLETKRDDHRGGGSSRRSRSWEHKDGESKRSRRDESPSGSRNKDRDRERTEDRHRHRERRDRDRSRGHREDYDEDRRDRDRRRSSREYDDEERRERRGRGGSGRSRHSRR